MRYIAILLLSIVNVISFAQSNTTEALNKKYSDSKVFFFYNNTLRMLNQADDKEFDALVKDIEKMKFLWVSKPATFGSADYKRITSDYKKESFEGIMTARYQGKNFDIFMKEKDGRTKGMVVLVNDSTNLYVLDIVGSVAVDKITSLYTKLDESSDIRKKISEGFQAKKSH